MPSTALVFTLPSHRSHLIACLDVPPSPAPPSTSPTPQLDLFDCPHPPPHSSSPFHRFISHLFTFPDVPPFSSPMPSASLVLTLLPHPSHLFACPVLPPPPAPPSTSPSPQLDHFLRLRPPPQSSSPFRHFVSHLFACPDVPPFSSPTSSATLVFTLPSLRLPRLFTCPDVLRHLPPLQPLGWIISCPFPPLHSSSPFHHFVSHLFSCPDVPPSPALPSTTPSLHFPRLSTCLDVLRRLPPLQPLSWIISCPSLHRTRLHPSITFVALYLLQRLTVRFPAASYPPPSSSNFSRRASLTSTLPLLLQLFTSNTSRCTSLLLVSIQFLMGTIYLFRPSCSLQDHLRRHIFRQVLAYRQSRQFALWEINQMECKMCSILEGQLK